MTEHRPTKPRRQRSADRVLHRDVTAVQIKCDFALAPFDRMANEMDHKWGIDRLVELVPADVAAKYGSAMAKLNQAINAAAQSKDIQEKFAGIGFAVEPGTPEALAQRSTV